MQPLGQIILAPNAKSPSPSEFCTTTGGEDMPRMTNKKIRLKIQDKNGKARFTWIKASNKKKYEWTGKRVKRFKVWKKTQEKKEPPAPPESPVIYESLAALSYNPAGIGFEDWRVWIYEEESLIHTEAQLEKELLRMSAAARMGQIHDAGTIRTQIDGEKTTDEAEPTNWKMSTYYGYINIGGYEYTAEKKSLSWEIKDKNGRVVSQKRRDDTEGAE